jgi:hypothetical protein
MNVFTLRFIIFLFFIIHSVSCQEFLRKLALNLLGIDSEKSESLRNLPASQTSSEICSIDIRNTLNKTSSGIVKEPLFLKRSGNGFDFIIPDENGNLTFKNGETALIACTSDTKPNFLTFSKCMTLNKTHEILYKILFTFFPDNKPSATIFCLSDDSFNINNQRHVVSEFAECNAQINGNALNLNQACGENGVLISIGFQLSDGNGFVKLIDVCYNKKRGSSIYSRHIIQGKAIKNAMKSSNRPSTFKTVEIPKNIDIAKSFTKAQQLVRLTEIFGDEAKAKELMDKTYLARGHLAPDGDFLFVSWQFTTYYYINTVPQWQTVNNGNWKVIEFSVRTKADQLKEDLIVFTGGHDTLKLNNKKISLESDGLDVPKWSWKIIKHIQSNSGIAFVTLNNPFATSSPQNLCEDICEDYKWTWKERKTLSKGYTICCRVSDLMQVIPSIPAEARVANILEK